MNLKGRDFLTLKDFTPEEIEYLVDLAAELKARKKQGIIEKDLRGKNVALIFEKTSTRTRCAFETAAYERESFYERFGFHTRPFGNHGPGMSMWVSRDVTGKVITA